jgi:exodeoxyribonuclease VII small subunit
MASKNDSTTPAGKGPNPDEGFEALYKHLEETVARLEQGNLTLEESIGLYEEGMKLARRCQELLQQAELRITRLQESFAGGPSVREEPAEYVAASASDPVDAPPSG